MSGMPTFGTYVEAPKNRVYHSDGYLLLVNIQVTLRIANCRLGFSSVFWPQPSYLGPHQRQQHQNTQSRSLQTDKNESRRLCCVSYCLRDDEQNRTTAGNSSTDVLLLRLLNTTFTHYGQCVKHKLIGATKVGVNHKGSNEIRNHTILLLE